MPKVRERSRVTQDFAVTPWQSRCEGSKRQTQDTLCIVEEAFLLASAPPASSWPPRVSFRGSRAEVATHEEDVDTTGWFTKAPQCTPDTSVPENAFNEVTATHPQVVAQTHEIDPDWGSGCIHGGSGPALKGLCQLAITPTGRGMGHTFITGTGDPVTRCYGLAVRPVAPGVLPDPCTDDGSTELLCARLTDFARGASVDMLVARTGGDMCRLAPPEDWLLRRWFGDDFDSGSDSDEERGVGADVALGRREWDEEREQGKGQSEQGDEGEADGVNAGDAKVEGTAEVGGNAEVERAMAEDEHEYENGRRRDAAECEADAAADGGGCGAGVAASTVAAGTSAATGPRTAAEWQRWWRRQRRQQPALELRFEPETLLSGAAALPKLAEFARPLLPPKLLAGITSGGLRGGSPAAAAAATAVGGEQAASCVLLGEAGERAAAGAGAARMQAGAGRQVGAEAAVDVEVEAVVCLGPVTLRGLPQAFLRGAG